MNNFTEYETSTFPDINADSIDRNEYNLEDNRRMLNDITYMYRNLTLSMRNVMMGYNSAINNYNQNISRFLTTMDDYRRDIHVFQNQLFHNRSHITRNIPDLNQNQTTPPSTPNVSNRNTPSRMRNVRNNLGINRATTFSTPMSLYSNLFSLPRTRTNVIPTFEDVVVAPTIEEINNAVETFEYVDGMSLINNRCPITMEDFIVDERISRIHHCGHTFREEAINSWFRASVRCPVCRYDIREDSPQSTSDISQNDITNNNIDDTANNNMINELRTQLSNMFTTAIQSQFSNVNDPSLNGGFTFDFPITVTSIREVYEEDDDDDL